MCLMIYCDVSCGHPENPCSASRAQVGYTGRMARVEDVAAAVIRRSGGRLDTLKLQKLVYCSQAWHLVWHDEPLFDDVIEAWAGGPVVPALYRRHRGWYTTTAQEWEGDPDALTPQEQETVEIVVGAYGKLSGRQLSTLTHRETPWRLTRQRAGLSSGQRGTAVIDLADIADYYAALDQDDSATPVDEMSLTDDAEPF